MHKPCFVFMAHWEFNECVGCATTDVSKFPGLVREAIINHLKAGPDAPIVEMYLDLVEKASPESIFDLINEMSSDNAICYVFDIWIVADNQEELYFYIGKPMIQRDYGFTSNPNFVNRVSHIPPIKIVR